MALWKWEDTTLFFFFFLGRGLLTLSPRSRSDNKASLSTSPNLRTMIYLHILGPHKISMCTRFVKTEKGRDVQKRWSLTVFSEFRFIPASTLYLNNHIFPIWCLYSERQTINMVNEYTFLLLFSVSSLSQWTDYQVPLPTQTCRTKGKVQIFRAVPSQSIQDGFPHMLDHCWVINRGTFLFALKEMFEFYFRKQIAQCKKKNSRS